MTELEQIEFIRERANVTYAEAREALQRCNYNTLETLVYLEECNKIKQRKSSGTASRGVLGTFEHWLKVAGEYISKGNVIRFVISKQDRTAINLPLNIIIAVTILMPPVIVASIVAALFTNHKIRFERPQAADAREPQNINASVPAVCEVKEAVVVDPVK